MHGDNFKLKVEFFGTAPDTIVDTKGGLHKLVGKRGEISYWLSDSYAKVVEGEVFWVFKGSVGSGEVYQVVIKDDKLVSFILERVSWGVEHVLDVKYLGKKIQHRCPKNYLLVGGPFFIGNKVGVGVKQADGNTASLKLYFQGVKKSYSGKQVWDLEGNDVVNVYVESEDTANMYVIFPDGKECLVYNGPRVDDLPVVHKISNRLLIVYCEHEDAPSILRYFTPPVGFYPIFLRKMDNHYFISANLEDWVKINKNCKLALPKVIDLEAILPYDSFIIPLEEALKKFARKVVQQVNQKQMTLER